MGDMSEGQLKDLVATITKEQQFKDRNELWASNRALVFQERPVVFPGVTMETEYRTPDPLDAADKYAARFNGSPFSITVSAQGPGPQAEKKAQAMENYDYRITSRWWSKGLFRGPIHDMCGVTGEGWMHVGLNRAILPIIPDPEDFDNDEAYLKRAKEVLDEFASGEKPDMIILEPIAEPESIYYTPDRKIIFSAMEVPLGPLQTAYGRQGAGDKWGKKGKSKAINESGGIFDISSIEGALDIESLDKGLWSNTIKLYIIEDADYIYHLVEDRATKNDGNSLHGLGCFKNVFGAPGFVPIRGRETNHPSAKHAAHPLNHGQISIAPNHNILSTVVYSGGILGEMQRIQLRPLPGKEAAEERKNNKDLEIELLGNRVVKFPDGYEAVQPNIGVNADTLNAHAQLELKMVKYGYPIELGSPGESDATSGYQQAVQRDAVANVIDPALGNIAGAINTILTLKDTAIQTLGVPVTFRNFAPTDDMRPVARSVMAEITIDPEEIVEVDRTVQFDSLTQYSRQAKIELGMTLLEKDMISEDVFYREYMGVDDPARLKRQKLMEKGQKMADEFALKATAALLGKVSQYVAAEATVDADLAPFLTPEDAMPADPMAAEGSSLDGTYTAGGDVPLEPAPPQESMMGATGGGYA